MHTTTNKATPHKYVSKLYCFFLSANNCETDRNLALELHNPDPENGIFVPECETPERYRKEQCHGGRRAGETRFCWCVDQKTGSPIPGTSVQDRRPNCTNIKYRPIKGNPRVAKCGVCRRRFGTSNNIFYIYIWLPRYWDRISRIRDSMWRSSGRIARSRDHHFEIGCQGLEIRPQNSR